MLATELLPPKTSFRPDEVAALLCLSRRTIYRMLADCRLEASRSASGGVRVPRQALQQLLSPEPPLT